MNHHLIVIPYDSGHRGRRMGAGPLHLVEAGAAARLKAGGPVSLSTLESESSFRTEIGTAFELHRSAAAAVSKAIRAGARPVVLSGNCNSSLGTVAGMRHASPDLPVGVVWFDGHGDCNTPETFEGDFLDAMGISTLTGRCWQALASTVPGFRPVPDERVILVGGHDADVGAKQVLARSRIAQVLPGRATLEELGTAIGRLEAEGVGQIYLHLDLDVLDAGFGRANTFAARGGLEPDLLEACVALVLQRCPVVAVGIASYDPAEDTEGTVCGLALDILSMLARPAAPEAIS